MRAVLCLFWACGLLTIAVALATAYERLQPLLHAL